MRLSTQQGFTYWILLFLIAVMGLLLANLGQTWKRAIQREKEAELLFIGEQFSKALTSYAKHTPPGQQQSPTTLDELLEDKRVPYPLHHLRKLYRDPITREADWVPVLLNGRIIAIHSASELTPIHTATLPSWVIIQKEGESDPQYKYWLFSRISHQ